MCVNALATEIGGRHRPSRDHHSSRGTQLGLGSDPFCVVPRQRSDRHLVFDPFAGSGGFTITAPLVGPRGSRKPQRRSN